MVKFPAKALRESEQTLKAAGAVRGAPVEGAEDAVAIRAGPESDGHPNVREIGA